MSFVKYLGESRKPKQEGLGSFDGAALTAAYAELEKDISEIQAEITVPGAGKDRIRIISENGYFRFQNPNRGGFFLPLSGKDGKSLKDEIIKSFKTVIEKAFDQYDKANDKYQKTLAKLSQG